MNPKNTKKSAIHENADANITCNFRDGDISRLGYTTHTLLAGLFTFIIINIHYHMCLCSNHYMAQPVYKKKHWLSIVSTGCSCQNRLSAVTKHDESRKEKQNTLEIRNTVVRKPKWIVEKKLEEVNRMPKLRLDQ